jgi:hypothetical protein
MSDVKQQGFWKITAPKDMSSEQWESLCDGCGRCCLQKLIDDDVPLMYHTSVACRYLDIKSCQCTVYQNRQDKVSDCTLVTADTVADYHWLPDTCVYRRVAAGRDLPDWHPLVTGNPKSTIQAGMTVRKWAVSEAKVPESQWGEHIIEIQQVGDHDEA